MAVRFASRTAALLEETSVAAFAERLFAHLARADQRRWAQAYLEGLLTTPGKKSVRRLAATVSASSTAALSLQQFVNSSPWDWAPARRELTRWAEEREPVRAWTLGRAVLPKRGDRSVGVQRRFVASSGRTLNCQLAMGVFLATRTAVVPMDWHLLLSERWAADQQLRMRARIPESVGHHPVWEHALALVDSMAERTRRTAVPVVADMSDCQDADLLLRGLNRRQQDFVVAVPGRMPVDVCGPTPPGTARSLSAKPAVRTVEAVLRSCSMRHPHTAGIGTAEDRQRYVRSVSCLVRLPAVGKEGLSVRPVHRLFAEWSPQRQRLGRIWITNLADRRMEEVRSLAALHGGTAATVTALEEDFGLCDFEGRSYPGWHHHMTLVSAAYTFGQFSG